MDSENRSAPGTMSELFRENLEETMNRLQQELAYLEKEQVDKASELKEGKKILAVWLLFRLRSLRKLGCSPEVILQDMEFEAKKAL